MQHANWMQFRNEGLVLDEEGSDRNRVCVSRRSPVVVRSFASTCFDWSVTEIDFAEEENMVKVIWKCVKCQETSNYREIPMDFWTWKHRSWTRHYFHHSFWWCWHSESRLIGLRQRARPQYPSLSYRKAKRRRRRVWFPFLLVHLEVVLERRFFPKLKLLFIVLLACLMWSLDYWYEPDSWDRGWVCSASM